MICSWSLYFCIMLPTSVLVRVIPCFYSIDYGKGDDTSMIRLYKSVISIFLEDSLFDETSRSHFREAHSARNWGWLLANSGWGMSALGVTAQRKWMLPQSTRWACRKLLHWSSLQMKPQPLGPRFACSLMRDWAAGGAAKSSPYSWHAETVRF